MELAARKDTAGAFHLLERIGAVTELPEGKVQAAAAVAYVEATGASKVALMVAPTWNEIEVVTGKVRDALRASGTWRGPDSELNTFHSLSWTVAQKRDPARYRTGQWVRFHLPRGLFGRHETLCSPRAAPCRRFIGSSSTSRSPGVEIDAASSPTTGSNPAPG